MISQSELARQWECSQPYIAKLVREGMPLTNEESAAEWLANHVKRRRSGAKAEDILQRARAKPKQRSEIISALLNGICDSCAPLHAFFLNDDPKRLELVRNIKKAISEIADRSGVSLENP